nr:immunoglobulin light chain junction region [Macaca mulatta]MOV80116.1 immunoglobulin light chain junction region [Macaca mulatta]MOV80307.1 immunoglobulin light chain junction region [Macaca mulatta]
CQQRYRFPLTF